ncbi:MULTISPECIES: hypothetical protein [unclassified Pseudomonas]|uniref:hypothetical protein n=1 Tax=unclassified Pseudomonas TaxID=196821 RepID=UPI0008719B18|nr:MULTISPECIES: hypothetical protein [unclassified Pseudomonas]SCW31316.1 hypothetical protein SAMN03159424_00276 [Pseudomonas sp. NFACC05-1]SCZ20836.1 hypothetical protein SAMN03159405_00571 [Pseudomonas sp. NFACC44-2]SDA43650.1 hypothetical protein SAMN03159429_00330 [Pseudomonas sp. NFACC51]SDY54381.1 hypothetical protein SAMN03159474_05692 [Pseudomonas sp. NFACC08-1]SEI49720.1 hypothetical protein SAMN03159298_00580 [Pseudomonas sp. NFACC07-1]
MKSIYNIPQRPHFTSWRWCGWAGYLYCIIVLIAWAGVAGFLPPPAQSLSVDETHQYYIDNSLRIRIGMLMILLSTPLYYIWGSAVSRTMQYVEGPNGTLSLIQLMGAFGTVVATWASCVGWEASAYDPELKTAQDIKLLADYSWLWFDTTVMVSVTQFVSFGCLCLIDKNPRPLFPKWLGWFSIAMGLSFLMAVLIPFFRTGPFAWNGLLCYYVGLFDFFIWIIIATHYVLKAIKRIEQDSIGIA